jgi:S1-C subfamily serine protease
MQPSLQASESSFLQQPSIMKKIISYVFAGMLGGLITLSGNMYFMNTYNKTPQKQESLAQSVKNINVAPIANAVPIDFTAAAQRGMPAVVHIKSTAAPRKGQTPSDPFSFFFGDGFEDFFGGGSPFGGMGPRQGSGSGVIYSDDGYIVTNNHVIEFADEIEVTLFDDRKFKAKLVGRYPDADLAVLQIEASGLPTMRLADSDKAQVGQWVLAIGNPFDLTSTVTAGIISAKGRDIDIIKSNAAIESFIQTDAAVNPGNSGGALVDASGNLLGINTAISTRTGVFEGYSFAIPTNIMKDIVEDIINHGDYQKGYLGVEISDLDSDYAEELRLSITEGVVVESLTDGGAAQFAGVLPKDVITAVNGKSVSNAPEMIEMLSQSKADDVLALTIIRNDRIFELPVKLKGEGRSRE